MTTLEWCGNSIYKERVSVRNNNRRNEMFTYVLITYKGESIAKDDCYIFQSDLPDLSIDPHNNDDVPIVLGSNQTIYDIEDSPYVPSNDQFDVV